MRLDNFFDVGLLHASIPNRFGIDDDRRTVLALVEASGFVGADGALQSKFSEPVFEGLLQFALCAGITTATRSFRIARVAADENMLLEFRHEDSLRETAGQVLR